MNSTQSTIAAWNDEKEDANLKELYAIFGSQEFKIGLYIILGVMILLSMMEYCRPKLLSLITYSSCWLFIFPINDDADSWKLISFALSFSDFGTDIAWTFEVCNTLGVNNKWSMWAILSVIVPWMVNIICAFIFLGWLKKNEYKQTRTNIWVTKHMFKFIAVVCLTGNGEPVLQLFNSKVINHNLFSMNLRYKTLYCWAKLSAVILNCICERLPQFIIQILYINAVGSSAGGVAGIALITSFVGVVATIIHLGMLLSNGCCGDFCRDERISLKFKLESDIFQTTDKYDKLIKYVFAQRREITKKVAKALSFEHFSLRCQYTRELREENSIEMVFEILSNDDNNAIFDSQSKPLNDKLTSNKLLVINGVNYLLDEVYKELFKDEKLQNPIKIIDITGDIFISKASNTLTLTNNHTGSVSGATMAVAAIEPVIIDTDNDQMERRPSITLQIEQKQEENSPVSPLQTGTGADADTAVLREMSDSKSQSDAVPRGDNPNFKYQISITSVGSVSEFARKTSQWKPIIEEIPPKVGKHNDANDTIEESHTRSPDLSNQSAIFPANLTHLQSISNGHSIENAIGPRSSSIASEQTPKGKNRSKKVKGGSIFADMIDSLSRDVSEC